jgi:hypothetical protein
LDSNKLSLKKADLEKHCETFDARRNELENEAMEEEAVRKEDMKNEPIALESRAENVPQKNKNFNKETLEKIDLMDTDSDTTEHVEKELDNKMNIEEEKLENFKENEGVRENLKSKCLSLIQNLDEKLSKKLCPYSKVFFSGLKNSASKLSNLFDKSEDFDLQNIESELFQLDKKANDGENIILLESLHSDLIVSLTDSYCGNEAYNKIRQEIILVHERIPKDYAQHYESLKMQMLKIKDDLTQNEKNFLWQESEKRESFKARCLELKNRISILLNERLDQNRREDLLLAKQRLTELLNSISTSNSSHFQTIEKSLCELENSLNHFKTKLDSTKNKEINDIKIKNAIKLFSEWNQNEKIYRGINYYYQMLDQCQQKLDNSISMNEFYKNIEQLVEKSNEECERQNYHKSNYIYKEDMDELYKALDLEQSSL